MQLYATAFPETAVANPGFVVNCVQVRLLFNDPSRSFMNVLHMVYTPAGPLNPNIADTIFSSLKANTSWTTLMTFLPANTTFTGVDVRDLRTPNFPLIPSTTAAQPGTSASGPLPPQTAIVLTLRTAFAGRAYRGRVFFGGLALNADDGTGHISSPGASQAVQGAGGAIGAAMVAAGGTWGILQRWLPARTSHTGAPLPERQPAVVQVQSFTVRDLIFDTQRRRTGAHIGSR